MDVFTLAEAATVLEMPKSIIRNWTIGRPLKFSPTVKRALGTGTRNLYSREDLYLFSLAWHMVEFGLSTTKIQGVLDQFSIIGRDLGGPHAISWVLLEPNPKNRKWIFVILIPQRTPWPNVASHSKDAINRYFVDFGQIRDEIDTRIGNLPIEGKRRKRARK